MGSKTKIVALAAAALVVLLALSVVGHGGKGTESARAPMLRLPKRTHSNPRGRSSELARRSEAIAHAQPAQAGTRSEPFMTADPSHDPDAYDGAERAPENGMPEDHSVYTWEPSQRFWDWRRTWADEAPDRTWAERLHGALTRWTGGHATATFHQIDCRETICQLYLHADDAQDAQAILATMNDDRLEVEHEQMAASVRLEDAPRGGTTYELVVRRDRPEWMPPHVPGAALAYFLARDAREATK